MIFSVYYNTLKLPRIILKNCEEDIELFVYKPYFTDISKDDALTA